MNEDKMFQIPYMVISKVDLLSLYEGRDDFEEMKQKIENLSEDQMQTIANKMSDPMLEDCYWYCLKNSFQKVMEID